MLDVGCCMLNVGCWMLDVGCWMLDVGCWMLDVGCWIIKEWCSSSYVCISFLKAFTQGYLFYRNNKSKSESSTNFTNLHELRARAIFHTTLKRIVKEFKSCRFGVSCTEVIPKAYIGTSRGELKCKLCRSYNF